MDKEHNEKEGSSAMSLSTPHLTPGIRKLFCFGEMKGASEIKK